MTKDIGYSEGKSALEVQDEIVEDFSSMGDPFDQFTYLLQLASELEELPEEQKTKASLLAGCQSQVWIHLRHEGDRVYFVADSDTLMIRGVIMILEKILNGRTAREILDIELDFIQRTDLGDVFDSKRIAGISSFVEAVKTYANELL